MLPSRSNTGVSKTRVFGTPASGPVPKTQGFVTSDVVSSCGLSPPVLLRLRQRCFRCTSGRNNASGKGFPPLAFRCDEKFEFSARQEPCPSH